MKCVQEIVRIERILKNLKNFLPHQKINEKDPKSEHYVIL